LIKHAASHRRQSLLHQVRHPNGPEQATINHLLWAAGQFNVTALPALVTPGFVAAAAGNRHAGHFSWPVVAFARRAAVAQQPLPDQGCNAEFFSSALRVLPPAKTFR